MEFSEQQLLRYARHIVLPEVGGVGQRRLTEARVLIIGAGGLGTPLLQYLAAAGVGTIGIIDDDTVDLSNLQRQVIHATSRIGWSKVESACAAAAEINPEVRLIPYPDRFDASNAKSLIADYDLVADGSDNFATRFLVNDACHLASRTLVSAAVLRFEGQISTFRSGSRTGDPCYRCLYSEAPPPGLVPSCSEAGVLGALAGAVGSLQAIEALKEIMEIGDSLAGSLLICDALTTTTHKLKLPRNPACALCGDQPTITDLSVHAE